MFIAYIQTRSLNSDYINPSWVHASKKQMTFTSEEDAILFCKYLCAYLNVLCRVTSDKDLTGYLVTHEGKLF